MKVLILLVIMFLQLTIGAYADSNKFGNIEKVDLNLKEHEMAVTFLGTKNGGSAMIQTSAGENALAYSGGSIDELQQWFKLYKVKEITKLIITRNDISTSELEDLIESYHVKEIVASPNFILWLRNNVSMINQIMLTSWQEGTEMEILPEVKAELQFSGTGKDEGMDFTLQFFKHRIFFMNSFSERAEQKLLKKNVGEVNVFKVPGSVMDNTLSEQLIEHVNPQVSILYSDHEGEALVNDLYQAWSEVYFTKKQKAVTIKFTQVNYEIFSIPSDINN